MESVSSARPCTDQTIDEYLRERLMPVEGAIPYLIREHFRLRAKEICNSLLEYALKADDHLRQIGGQDRVDDKTVFIVKRN